MRIEPAWITACTGLLMIVGGLVTTWFHHSTRIVLLERTCERLCQDIRDGDRRLSAIEYRLDHNNARSGGAGGHTDA